MEPFLVTFICNFAVQCTCIIYNVYSMNIVYIMWTDSSNTTLNGFSSHWAIIHTCLLWVTVKFWIFLICLEKKIFRCRCVINVCHLIHFSKIDTHTHTFCFATQRRQNMSKCWKSNLFEKTFVLYWRLAFNFVFHSILSLSTFDVSDPPRPHTNLTHSYVCVFCNISCHSFNVCVCLFFHDSQMSTHQSLPVHCSTLCVSLSLSLPFLTDLDIATCFCGCRLFCVRVCRNRSCLTFRVVGVDTTLYETLGTCSPFLFAHSLDMSVCVFVCVWLSLVVSLLYLWWVWLAATHDPDGFVLLSRLLCWIVFAGCFAYKL